MFVPAFFLCVGCSVFGAAVLALAGIIVLSAAIGPHKDFDGASERLNQRLISGGDA